MNPREPMRDRTVLVTGGTGGFGRATDEGLAALGARVGIVGRDEDRTEPAAAELARSTGGTVHVFVADMSAQAVSSGAQSMGRIDFDDLQGTVQYDGQKAGAPGLERVSGRCLVNGKEKRSSPRSYDEKAARRLWDMSARLVGLDSSTGQGRGPG